MSKIQEVNMKPQEQKSDFQTALENVRQGLKFNEVKILNWLDIVYEQSAVWNTESALEGAKEQANQTSPTIESLLEIIEAQYRALEHFQLSEENQHRLHKVPVEQVYMIIQHGNDIARNSMASTLAAMQKLGEK